MFAELVPILAQQARHRNLKQVTQFIHTESTSTKRDSPVKKFISFFREKKRILKVDRCLFVDSLLFKDFLANNALIFK